MSFIGMKTIIATIVVFNSHVDNSCNIVSTDFLKCTLYCRHEVPIKAQPIQIVAIDDDIVVVDKPASIPVSGVFMT